VRLRLIPGLFPSETGIRAYPRENVLVASAPPLLRPPPKPKASGWAVVGDGVASPFVRRAAAAAISRFPRAAVGEAAMGSAEGLVEIRPRELRFLCKRPTQTLPSSSSYPLRGECAVTRKSAVVRCDALVVATRRCFASLMARCALMVRACLAGHV
jgi:hypothetical protein